MAPGVNVLGAVAGGSLENVVMAGATVLLGYLALAIYGLTAAALLWHQRAAPAAAVSAATVV